MILKLFRRTPSYTAPKWRRSFLQDGIHLQTEAPNAASADIDSPLLQAFLTQLVDDGLALETGDGVLLSWDNLYAVLDDPAYAAFCTLLVLPPMNPARPALCSRNALSDANFSITLQAWLAESGRRLDAQLQGALLHDGAQQNLLTPVQWALLKSILAFAQRPESERNALAQRIAWGKIRKLAQAANAILDNFLHNTVVLTPEKLQIALRRSDAVHADRVIEIEPRFEQAPTDWLAAFDRAQQVRERYDLPTPEGIVQVLISPKLKTVLQEIKRMPGRRVAGSRAQAFMLNPFAALGEDAHDVLDENQFEQAREAAGLNYERFCPFFERDAAGFPHKLGLLIETAVASGPSASAITWLDEQQAQSFAAKLQQALERGHQLLAWQGYDLMLDGNTTRYLQEWQAALAQRQHVPPLVSYAHVHDLSTYSSRVAGIGHEKAYYSPYIAKKKEDEGWFPENILPMVVFAPKEGEEPIAVPCSSEAIAALKQALQAQPTAAKFDVSWLPSPLPVAEAHRIVATFEQVFQDIAQGQAFDPAPTPATKAAAQPRKRLVLRANIQSLEYEEMRREALQALPAQASLPKSIRPEYALLPHQHAGLAWLQHLYRLQNDYQVRGAILADDMGLGKTFQLLALIAWLLEQDPGSAPILVVAPVSLLENWRLEAEKFFVPGALPILTAYGDNLAQLRVPRAQIEQRLQSEDGLVKFLRPGWIGQAKLVLTTYETLRDLEFSFAAQKWSLMVCDEAQKIKNPAAMQTRAAKKQNVDFKIACTGTPVENTLADIWCLFDYVQPGLLGALNDFGQRYRKPIEAKTEEEKARVEELRAKIAPQILRRLKSEVATDLPPKIIVEDCRKLPLSDMQRNLYVKAMDDFKRRDVLQAAAPFKNHLGLLQYLRSLCTDPRQFGLTAGKPVPLAQYRQDAPKLGWLLRQLAQIKRQDEKVLVFCEFREIQRLLQHYIEAEFQLRPDIINGDSSAGATRGTSRQQRINQFQNTKGFNVLILSPLAVGFGVNIQAANHVIHYTRCWNPAKEDQATDRAYRIGQQRQVYVYYPIVRASDFTTFDAKLDQLLSKKRELAQDMLNGSGDLHFDDFIETEASAPGASVPDAADDERISLDHALQMDWQHIEALACVLWRKMGYKCYLTPAMGDNGVDVVALPGHNESAQLLQVKSSGIEGARLGWDAVKEVVAGAAFYQRRHPEVCFTKVCLTNQFFNLHAQENAALNGVTLLDQDDLADLLTKHVVTMRDVQSLLSIC